jgi:type II secretory pathway component HofQ
MLQDELWEMTLLHLARVTDPAFSFGNPDKANLSIQGLAAHVTDAKVKAELEKAVTVALAATAFARDWRNRLIAHRDLQLALAEPTTALADASRAQVNTALTALTAALNVLAKHHFDSETRFDLVSRHNGAVTLLYALHRGDKVQAARLKRRKEGKPPEYDDRDPKDI